MTWTSPFRMTRQKNTITMAFIAIGVGLRLLLADYPNIEPIMALSILAGYYLGGVYMILIPLSIMGFSDFLIYGALYQGEYGLSQILGLSAFTWTGFVFAALIGRAARGRVLTVFGSVALVTAISIPATIAYDLWTTLGGWYFIYGPLMGWTLWDSLVNLLPFALLHLISSLLFVPLFGTLFGLLQSSEALDRLRAPASQPEETSE